MDRFRRLLQVLPAIMLFRYGVVLKSWALLNLWSSSSAVSIWPALSNFFFLWGSNILNMIIVGDPACAAIPFVLETAIHRQIFNVIRRLYMSHATMLEMANQEHAQSGRPVAATNKSSTDVTSLWMRLPSALYLQQPEVLSSSTVIVLALSLPLQAECDSKKSYSHCNSFLETLIRATATSPRIL